MHRTARVGLPAVLAAAAVALATTSASAAPPAPRTERISVTATDAEADSGSGGAQLSADGRYAAFTSYAGNLVPGDPHDTNDVFVRDLAKGTLERVSVASDGTPGDRQSEAAGISADGRYVVFRSNSTNLAPRDPAAADWAYDVYVHDRRTGTTERVSTTPDGAPAYANWTAGISDDGRYVAFNARPSQLEPGETDINPAVYVHDRTTGATERVSNRAHPALAGYGLAISGNGRYVAYTQNGVRSGDGLVHVHDRRTGTEQQVNVTPDGAPSALGGWSPSLSDDGRTVAFVSSAQDLVAGTPDVSPRQYVRDLRTGTTRRVDPVDGGEPGSYAGQLSGDGRYLAYGVRLRVPGTEYDVAENVYVRNLRTGASTLASVSAGGGPVTDADVYAGSLDEHGRRIGLGTGSAQLVPGDTNGLSDAFVRGLRPGSNRR
ncbi:TolB family protein [Streptomyces sp. cg35]|uniref:TolB family protein n=1 Tax=Streptomyces sp. cg35 TaxID=3421650 RepID=UPI003D165921